MMISTETHWKSDPQHTTRDSCERFPGKHVRSVLEQLGPSAENESARCRLKLESMAGRALVPRTGDNNGHCWGTVQAIKRPTLLEFSGPLFMSYPVVNNVQYRLSEEKDGTLDQSSITPGWDDRRDHRKG